MKTKFLFGRLSMSVAVLVCLNLFLLSCGSSRQQTNGTESINIDELLGEENEKQADNGAEQAEVLRLLGITTEEDKQAEAGQEDALQGELEQLKQDLMQKDQEISALRSDITQKEMIITDLESKANTTNQVPTNINISGQFGEPTAQFKSKYETALNQFKARNYQPAISAFSELLSIDANSSLSDNCQYWIGESYYGMENYNQAIVEFAKVFSFPNTNKADDAQLKLGISHLKLGERNQAMAEFQTLLSSYPNSEYVELAQRYLAKL